MNKELNHAIHTLADYYQPPAELKTEVMTRIMNVRRSSPKWRITISVAIIVVMVPMLAFIKQYFYADQLYGSFSQFQSISSNLSLGVYERFDNKILSAVTALGPSKTTDFLVAVKNTIQIKVQYANEYGAVDHYKLSPEAYARLYHSLATVQPYFDELNGMNASNDILTDEQFKLYIESLIIQNSLLAQSQTYSGELSYTFILPELEEQYAEVSNTIIELEQLLIK